MKTVQPLGSNVLIKVITSKTDTKPMLDMPEKYKDKPFRGEIINMSNLFIDINDNSFKIEEGDIVIFRYFHGQPVVVEADPDNEYMLVDIGMILGKEVELQ